MDKFKGTAEIQERVFKQFATHWEVHVDVVGFVYDMMRRERFRYTKVSRITDNLGMSITPRQLKYFKKKLDFLTVLAGRKPANYSQLLSRNT